MRYFQSILIAFSLFISLVSNAQSYSINGNTLITTDKVEITIGSYMKLGKPYNGQKNFTSVFSEISLKSTSAPSLPKGVSEDQSGKEFKVRKFYERKSGSTTKVFVIVGGGILNQAIDIDQALNRGEVFVPRPSSDPVSSTAKSDPAKSGIFAAPLRFPWSKKPETKLDSSKWVVNKPKSTTDSVKTIAKTNILKKDTSMIKPVMNASNAAPIIPINTPITKPSVSTTLPVSQNTLPAANPPAEVPATVKPEPLPTPATSFRTTEPSLNTSNPVSSAETTPAIVNTVPTTIAPTTTEPAHSVSSLLTIHPVESPKPAEKQDATTTKDSKGYDKYTKLKQLKELYDQGILNKEEFEAEKKKILSNN